jgi:pimeloyl-ACP methyl ester carboxylesterase
MTEAMMEEVLVFGEARSLIGVVTRPAHPAPDDEAPAVIMLNAGLTHRIGPNRIYVKIARALAACGLTVLRMDLAGVGDSAPRAEHLPIEQGVLADVRAAMDALAQAHGCRRFVLAGHCSGAYVSLLGAGEEPRVAAAVLINPQGGGAEWAEFDRQRKVANFYTNYYGSSALVSRERWRKLLSGKADYRSIVSNVVRGVIWGRISALLFRARAALERRTAPEAESESSDRQRIRGLLRAIEARGAPLLFIHTKGSTGHEYLHMLAGDQIDRLCAAGMARVTIISGADHLFNLLVSQEQLVEAIRMWAQELVLQPQV